MARFHFKKKKKNVGNVLSFSKSVFNSHLSGRTGGKKTGVQKQERAETSGKTWEDANVNSLESIPRRK